MCLATMVCTQGVLLFSVLAVNSNWFQILWSMLHALTLAARSYVLLSDDSFTI